MKPQQRIANLKPSIFEPARHPMAHARRRAHDRMRAGFEDAQDGLGPLLRPGLELQRRGGGPVVFDRRARQPLATTAQIRIRLASIKAPFLIRQLRHGFGRKRVPLPTQKPDSVGRICHAGVDAVGLERGERVETLAGENAPASGHRPLPLPIGSCVVVGAYPRAAVMDTTTIRHLLHR